MTLFRIFFPFLCRQPRVGDVYIHVVDSRDPDPFNPPTSYTILEVRDTHVRYEHSFYKTTDHSMSIRELLCFYRLRKTS